MARRTTEKESSASTNCMCMNGGSGTWIADEEIARGSGIAEFSRSSRGSNSGFSQSECINVASFSEISDRSVFERVEKRANV